LVLGVLSVLYISVYVVSVNSLSVCQFVVDDALCVCSRQRRMQTDTMKDDEDIDIGLALPQRTHSEHATDMSAFLTCSKNLY